MQEKQLAQGQRRERQRNRQAEINLQDSGSKTERRENVRERQCMTASGSLGIAHEIDQAATVVTTPRTAKTSPANAVWEEKKREGERER